MSSRTKKIFNSAKEFIHQLHVSTRGKFKSNELRAEVILLNARTQHEEFRIEYEMQLNGQWKVFSVCQSPVIDDIISDFTFECRSFKIAI